MAALDHSSPRLPLSRDRIVRAAVLLVDRRGLRALTMRGLGAELGVEAMSLYKQYGNVPMPNVKLTEQQALDLMQYMQAETHRVNAISSNKAPPTDDSLEGIVTMPPATLNGEASLAGDDSPQDQARLETSPAPEVQ